MPYLARIFSLVEYSLLSKMIGEFTFMCLVISKDNINQTVTQYFIGQLLNYISYLSLNTAIQMERSRL